MADPASLFTGPRELRALAYISTATHIPSASEIDHLLDRARQRNLSEGVTGMLLYSHGRFMQVIEGPSDGVDRVFEAILADGLHTDVIELLDDAIRKRDFEGWAMAYRRVDGTVSASDDFAHRLLALPGDLDPVHHLLAAFWDNGFLRGNERAFAEEAPGSALPTPRGIGHATRGASI